MPVNPIEINHVFVTLLLSAGQHTNQSIPSPRHTARKCIYFNRIFVECTFSRSENVRCMCRKRWQFDTKVFSFACATLFVCAHMWSRITNAVFFNIVFSRLTKILHFQFLFSCVAYFLISQNTQNYCGSRCWCILFFCFCLRTYY